MKKYFTRNKVPALVLGVLLILVSFSQAEAVVTRTTLNVELKNDFVVTPGKTEVILDPGQEVVKTITITNRTNKKMSFSVQAEDFVGSEDPQTPVVLIEDGSPSPYSLREFIHPEITSFDLEFGERITIPVTISLPPDAEAGGYYGAIIISNKPTLDAEDASTGGARAISRIGSLILVRVNGPVDEEGSLEGFKVGGPEKWFHDHMPGSFEILYRNTGSVHLVPHGVISIKNIFGKQVAEVPVDAYFAMPESLRYREIIWNTDSVFSFGRYTAELSHYRGYGDHIDTSKISFFVFPWKIVVPALLLLIIVSIISYFLTSRFEFRKKS